MKKIILLAFLILILIIVWFAWQILKPSSLGQDFISGNGRIEATDIDIATKLPGKVIKVFTNEGEFVKAGQVLVQMQINILQAELEEAKAKHRLAINAFYNAEAQVAGRESDLAAADALVVQRENELDAAQRRFARTQALIKKGAISAQQFDDDRATVRTNEATLKAAKAQVKAASHAINAAKAQLIGAQSSVEAAAATVKRIEEEIDDSQLKAPRDAYVQYQVTEVGEMLPSGGKVFNLVDLTDIYMVFFLPEMAAGKVSAGSEVRIILDYAPNFPIPAKVTFVSDIAQFTPKTVETASERQKLMFRVKAKVDVAFLKANLPNIKTGLPGVAWIKLNPNAKWPKNLMLNTQQ